MEMLILSFRLPEFIISIAVLLNCIDAIGDLTMIYESDTFNMVLSVCWFMLIVYAEQGIIDLISKHITSFLVMNPKYAARLIVEIIISSGT